MAAEAPIPVPPIPVPKVNKKEVEGFGKDFLAALRYAQQAHGDLVQIPLGTSNMFLASHPDLAQQILIEQKENFVKLGADGRKTGLQAVLGQGLLTNTELDKEQKASWFEQRQMMQPLFYKSSIELMKEKLYTVALEEITSLASGKIDLYQLALDITQKMIYQLLFSEDVPEEHVIDVPLRLATSRPKQVREIVATLRPAVHDYIQKRKQTIDSEETDLLDLLLAAEDSQGNRMTDEQLCDEILTIFSAGHETTASAISWTMYCLLKHPECLERLQTELSTKLSKADALVNELDNLSYCQNVLKETLRLYPAIPAAPRSVLKHTSLNGYRIPQASKVFLSIYNIHRHPDFWDAPEDFNPNRFDDLDAKHKQHKLAYMPFGAGPRFCIGNHLAMMEATLVIVLLLQHFDIELVQKEVATKVAISLFPKDGVEVELKRL